LDLFDGVEGVFFISSDFNVEYITLFVKMGETTKAIDIKQD